jgi:hypothetical protein
MKSILRFVLVAVTAVVLAGPITGCKNFNRQLETGGAYAPGTNTVVNGELVTVPTGAPDRAFFAVDSAFQLAHAVANAVFSYERENRLLLWNLSPDIKRDLDKIRPQYSDAVRKYAAARRAYTANPTPAGLSDLQTTLLQLQNFANAASAVLPK